MSAFLEKHKDDGEDVSLPQFNASRGFIYDFKKNHGISSRKCHTKRRPNNKSYDQHFVDDMKWLFENVDEKYIINVDETSWNLVPSFIKTWHPIGRDHVVRYLNGNDKDKITVVASICADGTKLPLQFIAKGETSAVVESQIGDVGYHMKTFSSNGWTTAETFKQYLTGIRNHYSFEDNNTIHILLDVFKAHITSDVKETAESLNIQLHLIPAGMTDELQPLDKKIFGPLKMFARHLFHTRYADDPEEPRSKLSACQDMVRAWERLSSDTIRGAFEHLTELDTWCLEQRTEKINLKRHHREYCTSSAEKKKILDETEEYKEI